MRRAAIALLAGAAVAMPIWASSRPAPRPAAAPLMSPQQIVDARRAAMRLSAADIQLLRTAAEKGADVRPMARAARSLAEWGTVLPALFPAGTGPTAARTQARPEIWSNRADFEQRARTFSEAAEGLVAAAVANDMTAGAAAWDATWESCNACHRLYRSEPAPSQPR